MKCIITGVETNYKWRSFPIKREFVELAKLMENEQGFKDCTTRERIIILQQRWQDRVRESSNLKDIKPKQGFLDKAIQKLTGMLE